MLTALQAARLVGWTVSGRHGPLGRIVAPSKHDRATDDEHLLVRGGTTDVLYYFVPLVAVTQIEPGQRAIRIDADIADFTAHLRTDGSVDLFRVPNSTESSPGRTRTD